MTRPSDMNSKHLPSARRHLDTSGLSADLFRATFDVTVAGGDPHHSKTSPISQLEHDGERALGVSLVVYHRDGAEAATLRQGRALVVGRVAPADLVVPDASLSRQHARFRLLGEQVVVEDLGSTNGTWIAGESINTIAVRPGTVLTLGAATAVLKPLGDQPFRGLASHDRFVSALEREVTRGRFFERNFALAMVRTTGREAEPVHRWLERLQRVLRPVDRIALYSADTIEILLPEMTVDGAAEMGAAIAASGEPELAFAVSAFPESATTAGGLVDACRSALRHASASRRVSVAEPATTVVFATPADGDDEGLVAESRSMQEALVMAQRVARHMIPVLLHGETGTGKEVLARFIHDRGPRQSKPLVSVNCGAIPEQLVESTLFGNEKGAYTGATHMKKGVFEAADGGSVLLDEIAELPAAAQAALLRVLETKKVTRVGSTKEIEIDVRILAASHQNLEDRCRTGAFRKDLFYRLNGLILEIPPLRERRDDIPPLALRFLDEFSRASGRQMRGIEPAALDALRQYDWPGNVRELRNAIERAVVIAEHDLVTLHDLPSRLRESAPDFDSPDESKSSAAEPSDGQATSGRVRREGESFNACIERLEVMVLIEALQAVNKTEAARILQMPRRTLMHKIKTYGIKRGDYRQGEG